MGHFETSFILYGPPDSGKMSTLKKLPLYEEATLLDLSETALVLEIKKDKTFLESLLDSLNPQDWLIINHYDRIHKTDLNFIEKCLHKGIFLALTSVQNIPAINESGLLQIHFQHLNYYEPLDSALKYGLLPKVQNIPKSENKIAYLKTYLQNYIDEHVLAYSSIRHLVPFHLFMERIKNYNAQKINFTHIAENLGVDYKTIQNYFQILIQTHIGYYLPASTIKLRAVQNQSPQFFLFDPGLIHNETDQINLLKTLCINQLRQQNHLQLSHIETKDGLHIDLVIKNSKTDQVYFINFCNQKIISRRHLKNLILLGKNQSAQLICVNLQSDYKIKPAEADSIKVINVNEFLKTLF